ncbi:membrane protein [Chlorobiota bacterium]|nr:membrane protein [Chlorobiota bacterium]
MSSKSKAIILLICTAILWSQGGFLIKLIHWHPVAIAGGRSIIAALIMWAYVKKPKFTWSYIQIMGAVAYALTVILFVIANTLTTAANTILLQYTGPIYVALFSYWFLKEKITAIDWISILTVILGMTLFFIEKLSPDGILGNFIAILAGIAFAGLALCLRKQKDGSPLESLILGNILTGIIGLPFIIDSGIPSQQSIIALLVLGIFQLGLPYILYSKAIKHISALDAVLIPVLEPILNPLWVFLLLGESIGMWPMIGGAIIIVAITTRSILYKTKTH